MKPRFVFKVEPCDDRWMPIGTSENGDECWCDGCVVDDKQLAERIAANMEAAYNQGVEDAARDFVQHAIKLARANGLGSISDVSCGEGVVVYEREEPVSGDTGED